MSEYNYKLIIYPATDVDHAAKMESRFTTRKEMYAAKNTSADLLLFMQDEMTIMQDYSNIFLCEELVNGLWEEVDEDEV
tara:strand:- start:125 stop:361 length:237 start_codon:yes stop_codon:yes gene_type:complete